MAARHRGRQAAVKDGADEEHSLWSQVQADAKKIDSIITQHNQKWTRMNELKDQLEGQWAENQETDADLEDELMQLCRENLKHIEDAQALIEGPSENGPSSLIGSINILKALRQSSENDTHSQVGTPSRTGSSVKAGRNAKRKANSDSMFADDAIEAASTSTKAINASNRLKVSTAGSRAGSAAPLSAGREASIKIEDGVESGAESKESIKISLTGAGTSGRAQFVRGAEVFYRSKKASHPRSAANMGDDQGEGILCTITAITGEGKARKYEIIDVEPDEGASPYQAKSNQMAPIPTSNDGLSEPSLRKTVLAMYPGTTTFYRAEVTAVKGKDIPLGHIKLRFEDEDEKNKENLVERRYILTEWPGRY